MIGEVRSHEALLCIPVLNHQGTESTIEAMLDTGATCWMSLPSAVIRELGLHWEGRTLATLAGDLKVVSHIDIAWIRWDGMLRLIEVNELEGTPLIGNRLLEGHHIAIDLVEGGVVEVIPLNLNSNHNLEEQHDA